MWLERARRLADEILARFWDDGAQALFDTASDAESLVTRPRDVTDNATPSGTSLAIELLLKLGDLFAIGQYSERGRYLLETVAEPMARYPTAFGHALGAADLAVRGAIEVAIAGDPSDERFRALASVVAERYLPSLVLAGGDGERRRASRCSRDAAATRRWRTCAARTRATRRRATSRCWRRSSRRSLRRLRH